MRRRLFTRGRHRSNGSDDVPCVDCAKDGARLFGLLVPPEPVVAPDDVLARSPGRLETVVEGQLLVFDPRTGNAHLLNPSAALVLTSVDGRSTVDEIIDGLHLETGVDRDVLARDVVETLGTLVHGGLVTWFFRDPGDPPAATTTHPDDLERARDRWRAVVEHRLDAVSWPTLTGPSLAGGATVIVRTNSAEVADLLADAMASLPPAGPVSHDAPSATLTIDRRAVRATDRFRVHAGGQRVGWVEDPAAAVDLALAGLNQIVADGTADRLLIHAGVVEADGRVVLVAGRSGRGKSTLTAALVQHGLGYVSDELAIVESARHQVTTYPKALELDDDAVVRLGLERHRVGGAHEHHVAPIDLGWVSDGGVVGLIVLLDDPAAGGEAPVELSPAQAMLRLLSDVLPQTWRDAGALDALAELCEQVPAVLLPRLDLAAAVAAVSALATGSGAAPTPS